MGSHLNTDWVKKFLDENDRLPRILHIGNIANNAYNNALILRQMGFDCHVICYDYYHIMGCPEWDGAYFEKNIQDQFSPKWHSVNLNGFQRPKWFAQGHLIDCINYLKLFCVQSSKSDELWTTLSIQNRTIKLSLIQILAQGFISTYIKLHIGFFITKIFHILRLFNNKKFWIYVLIYKILLPLGEIYKRLKIHLNIKHKIGSDIFSRMLMRKYNQIGLYYVSLNNQAPIINIFSKPFKIIKKILNKKIEKKNTISLKDYNKNIKKILDNYKTVKLHDVTLPFMSDFKHYRHWVKQWQSLFVHYEIVIGYATDGIWPLICGKPYFAFEHGTIREIPFQKTPQGRLCALTYSMAEHVFVSNFDCQINANKFSRGRYTIINHPFDEDQSIENKKPNTKMTNFCKILDADILFFHPTRHDWVEGTGFADKGNDIFLRALASLRKKGNRVGLITVSWGKNIKESKILLQKLGIKRNTLWINPQPLKKFIEYCKISDFVVDQFKLGSFGGIMFKSLACGTPIITFLDELSLLKQYTEIPPVINCSNEEKIISKVEYMLENPKAYQTLGKNAINWMKKYHNKNDTVDAQMRIFKENMRFQNE